ncbi:LPS O-antigen chain length determinant protein WzzB [Cronobacter turicensis]|uniref:LPS O-antigen chain length determinant protein WzzB n=1 Tax=Cronobacter turicensis TaxID=413502 RepID=UPI001D3E9AAB|nr:LPS O-antigen chain length determinant protein WzzB [Cronobacter turicensis]EGT4494502.1 LPS O-antigen chain length determinant protein WzzB [Cronobacter turicensis]EKM0439968.1 LPS O-antigen chain length determinant protein WzzB [Cronobacter turicensis]ELY4321876.1 LPS O-antigen chain length determinant protein WzzB [Cronobacter turicensis]ELY5945497.1 LPS O-antigen chain length determinant protein WzzB [Cronobacter turicensis]ELY5966041.1 LPS O-antigen chain length determinant protein Wzz
MSKEFQGGALQHSNGNPEQIDLIDLLMQLWRGKVTIVATMIVMIILAVLYLFVAKEKWTSTAIVTMPDAGQIASYNNAMNILYGANAPNVTDVQQRVVGRFSSAFSALSETLQNQQEPEQLTIDMAVKGQPLPLKVTYQGASAQAAQKKLAEYIQQVDEQIAKELNKDITDNVTARAKELQESLSTQEKVAQEQKDLRIKQIAEALKFAQESNVSSPQMPQAQEVSQDTLFLLGSEALSSMIKNESTRPLVFTDAYYLTKQNLLDISKLKIDEASLHAYRYVMKPTEPLRRDSPKRALVLVLAVLLGGLIGSAIVLCRNAIREHTARQLR